MLWVCSCARTPVPDVRGTWSGEMVLELGKGNSAFVDVEVAIEQSGENIRGRWRTVDSEAHVASGDLTGTLTRTPSHQQVDVTFTFVGHHAGSPASDGRSCQGTARASGMLTYNVTTGPGATEKPGRYIRLKAFDGFGFESCAPIRYATWSLGRPQAMPQP